MGEFLRLLNSPTVGVVSTWLRKLAYVVPISLRYPLSEGTTNRVECRTLIFATKYWRVHANNHHVELAAGVGLTEAEWALSLRSFSLADKVAAAPRLNLLRRSFPAKSIPTKTSGGGALAGLAQRASIATTSASRSEAAGPSTAAAATIENCAQIERSCTALARPAPDLALS